VNLLNFETEAEKRSPVVCAVDSAVAGEGLATTTAALTSAKNKVTPKEPSRTLLEEDSHPGDRARLKELESITRSSMLL